MSNNSLEDIEKLEEELSNSSNPQLNESPINFDDSVSEINSIHSHKSNYFEKEGPFKKGTFGKDYESMNANMIKRNIKPLKLKLNTSENKE